LKPNASNSVLTLGVAEREIEMSIDISSAAFIMKQLTDLYSDPILACVREYSTNANDSHSFAGQTRPIEITLPTLDDLHFTVEDWGVGMDEDDIVDVYSKYGASTGRHTNEVAGMLGFGSKSAMTYGNSFRVEATKNGVTLHAVVTKSDDDIPRIRIMSTFETDRGNGVKIVIPVKSHDIGDWANRANNFYRFWRDPVLVNDAAPSTFYEVDDDWVQVEDDIWVHLAKRNYYTPKTSWFIQGGVPYPVDMTEYLNTELKASDIFVCYVDTGLLDFTPSREQVMFTDRSNDLINVARQCARQCLDRHITKVAKDMSVFEKFRLAFKLPDGHDALTTLDLSLRYYKDGRCAWHLSNLYDNLTKINHHPSYPERATEFTKDTIELARTDDVFRFVRNFGFRRPSKRHIASLYAYLPKWASKDVVFLPKAQFDTDDFPGIDWEDVPLLKVERKAYVRVPITFWVTQGGHRRRWQVEEEVIENAKELVVCEGGVGSRTSDQWPEIIWVEQPKKVKEIERLRKLRPDTITWEEWRDRKVKQLARQLRINDKRWICSSVELRRLSHAFLPYTDSITNPAFRKMLLKPPANQDLIDSLDVLYATPANIVKQFSEINETSKRRMNEIREEFPLLPRHNLDENRLPECVIYINAKGRQRKPIEPNGSTPDDYDY